MLRKRKIRCDADSKKLSDKFYIHNNHKKYLTLCNLGRALEKKNPTLINQLEEK